MAVDVFRELTMQPQDEVAEFSQLSPFGAGDFSFAQKLSFGIATIVEACTEFGFSFLNPWKQGDGLVSPHRFFEAKQIF